MKSEVAHTLKSLTSKLHGTLPLTPRSSQQLLSKLNAAFKEQFDRQHLAASQRTQNHADFHLQSILKDPLFDARPPTRETSTSKTNFIGQFLGHHTTQALDAFRERASQGKADFKMAKLYLTLQYQACVNSGDATPKQTMQTSGAGSTILQWLWSSGREDTGIFLDDPGFVDMLFAFLVAEGQLSRISPWIQRCHDSGERPFSSISALDSSRIAKQLFEMMLRHEIRIGDGLESAVDLFLRTVADLRSAGFERSFIRTISTYAARGVVRTIIDLPNSSKPQPPIFYAFSTTVRSMNPDNYTHACLGVYLQKRPDPQPALTLFQSPKFLEKKPKRATPRLVLLGLRAAELFLKDGRQKEALWIMEFLQANFKLELGLSKCRERQAKPKDWLMTEERNLQLLDTLTVY